jgi:hypothetical protein
MSNTKKEVDLNFKRKAFLKSTIQNFLSYFVSIEYCFEKSTIDLLFFQFILSPLLT